MRISNATPYYINPIRKSALNEHSKNAHVLEPANYNPTFNSWSRTVYLANEFGQKTRFPKNCQDTWIYRGNAKKFVKFISETELNDDEIRDFISHINYRINLLEELSFEELNTINPRFFTGDWGYPEIDVIRRRISQIPERMRSYIKYADKYCELIQYCSSWFDSENTAPRVIAAIERLNTLSDRDLNNIGAKGLNRFLDESKYHLADGATFPKEKLEQLSQLPQGMLERLQEHSSAIYNLLMDEANIDVKTMISRYKLLENNGLLESGKIYNDNFYALMFAGEEKFSVISEILPSSIRKSDACDL